MILTTADATHIVVPWREDLAQLMPHAKRFTHAGQDLLLFPNNHDEAKLARNLGVPVPAPILTRYDWMGQTPWDIQRTTAALLTESERAYVLSTMGCGKTRAALFASDYLLRCAGFTRVLIAAPLSTLSPVWEAELFRVMPQRRVRVLHGDRAKRLRLLAEDADFYVINHHGLHMLQKELAAKGFDIIVIDELAVFRNKSTRLWKSAAAVIAGPSTQYVWGLTGAPTPTAPTDAWAQIRLLTPARTTRTMSQFQDQTMRKVSDFKWVPRTDANDTVFKAMQPSVRFTRDDVMELPETTYVDRDVKPEPEAAKAYKMLFDKMRHITQSGQSITAANEGVLQNKLLQVACGFIYTDDRKVYALPNQSRLDVLEEVTEETDRKIIVFVPYIHALHGIAAHLTKNKHSVAVVYGATPRHARDKIFQAFQEAPDPRIIVAHPQTMAHGLTLTAANTIIWYGPTQSLEIYEQANARITRPGQTSKTLIVHLAGTTVEKMTYTRLRQRARMQGMLLDLFKNQELEF
jgi:SNF2 family DNA or RNA helicase